MIMYHGTIKAYADNILVEGIKPMPDRSFRVKDIPIPHGIYLTPDKDMATSFAWIRSAYSQVNPGEVYDLFDFSWKRRDGQPRLDGDITPVLVKVDIPEDKMAELKPDPDYIGSKAAYNCYCSIPADRVIEVIPIPNGGN